MFKPKSQIEGFVPYYTFVYGTLMRAHGNHHILLSSEFIGEAVTIPDCYTMLTGGFPYVLKNGISHVKGELYRISDENIMHRLDGLEGVPNHYIRHDTTVACGDENIDCIMYVASPGTEKYMRDHWTNYVKERIVVPNGDNVLEWSGPNWQRKAS